MKNFFQNKLPESNPTHATLLAIVGGYFVWMSYKMYQNTATGVSTMSMTTTVILMVIMDIVALLIFIYAGYVFWHAWKAVSNAHEENEQKSQEALTDEVAAAPDDDAEADGEQSE